MEEMVSKSRRHWISISYDYKKILKSREMLITWGGSMGFAPTHSENRALELSMFLIEVYEKFVQAHMLFDFEI
jgi:hypothetical protein